METSHPIDIGHRPQTRQHLVFLSAQKPVGERKIAITVTYRERNNPEIGLGKLVDQTPQARTEERACLGEALANPKIGTSLYLPTTPLWGLVVGSGVSILELPKHVPF